ncbi:hypothetical protein SRHO_G00089940 [Serrasalmus rhombeus]
MWEEVGFWMESRLAEGVDPPSASAHSEQGNLSKTELNINLEKRKLERRSGSGQPRRNTSNRPTPGGLNDPALPLQTLKHTHIHTLPALAET